MTQTSAQQVASLYPAFVDKLESPPEIIIKMLTDPIKGKQLCRLLHAVLGMAGEVGELCDAIKKTIVYGKPLDMSNVKEEFGDIRWYYQLGVNASDLTDNQVVAGNQGKLTVRYPEKWSAVLCEEQNRDRTAELEAMEAASVGLAPKSGAVL